MKKISILFLFTIVFQLAGFSQYRKGCFYLDANYNYINKSNISDGLGSKDIKSTFAPDVGYFVIDNFVVGVGLLVNYRDLSQFNQGSTGYQNGVLFVNDHITNVNIQTGIAPSVFAKYILPVNKELSFSLMVKSFKGWQNQHIYQKTKNMVSGYIAPYTIPNDSSEFEGFTITPEIRYLLTDRIGVQLNFNGFSMSTYPSTNPLNYNGFAYSSQYQTETTINHILYIQKTTVNFNPLNWSLGFFIVLGNNHPLHHYENPSKYQNL
jgi:hypothetical protein